MTTTFLILYGGVALFALVVWAIDIMGKRDERRSAGK